MVILYKFTKHANDSAFRDSRHPNLAEVLQLKADYLKFCNPFLKEKRGLCAELQTCLDENKELSYATKQVLR